MHAFARLGNMHQCDTDSGIYMYSTLYTTQGVRFVLHDAAPKLSHDILQHSPGLKLMSSSLEQSKQWHQPSPKLEQMVH